MGERPRCFVGNLGPDIDSEALLTAFASSGALTAKVRKNPRTGQLQGFGHVELLDDEAVEEAILSMNGTELAGRTITVCRDTSTASSAFTRKAGIASLVAQAAAEADRGGYHRPFGKSLSASTPREVQGTPKDGTPSKQRGGSWSSQLLAFGRSRARDETRGDRKLEGGSPTPTKGVPGAEQAMVGAGWAGTWGKVLGWEGVEEEGCGVVGTGSEKDKHRRGRKGDTGGGTVAGVQGTQSEQRRGEAKAAAGNGAVAEGQRGGEQAPGGRRQRR